MATVTSIHGKRLGVEVGTNDLVILGGIKKESGAPVPFLPKLPSYTVAGVPSAATLGAGTLIFVSNGNAGAPTIAYSTGSAWFNAVTGTAISAT